MKKTVYLSDFVREFEEVGRGDQFSCAALETLFAYLEEIEEDCGEEFELDVIALCCDWGEYTKEELFENYGHLAGSEEGMSDEEYLEELLDELRANTAVMPVKKESTWLIRVF